MEAVPTSSIRTFITGATRNSDEQKFDYEGFLSPFVLERFGLYMHKHRQLADGSLRPSDNWQKGIPQDVYLKSLLRHVLDLWLHKRGAQPEHARLQLPNESMEDALCAIIFNAQGLLHERIKSGYTGKEEV